MGAKHKHYDECHGVFVIMACMSENEVNIHNRPNRRYELIKYDPVWASRFDEIASNIKPIFGDNLVQIEHVGSTAVPGMTAKPIVDVSVAVKDLASVPAVYEAMKELGFQPLGDFIQRTEPEEYFVQNGENSNDRLANIHVMQVGNPEINDMITLRDFLRSNASAADEYVKQKQLLMKQYGSDDYNAYSKNKRSFLERLKTDARRWKLTNDL